ncbi:MAG: hypothetical protein EA384_08700 [Spirochaetaceae bacterium]|nr:MAG: hypothetical protein EA384_08700 [Spirochaetaceae bacterium]
MTVEEIVKIVNGSIVTSTDISHNHAVSYGFASDLMSDVLTVTADQVLLITGLSNAQTVRTAMMSDIHVVLFGRNKKVTAEMRSLAEQNEIVLLSTAYSVFRAAGELYRAGLKPIF